MSTEPSILVMLGIAVAELILGIVNCALLIVHSIIKKREASELKIWQQGVERQLGRIEGAIAVADEKK